MKSLIRCRRYFFSIVLTITFGVTTSCNKNRQSDVNEQIEISSIEMKPDDYFQAALEAFAMKDYKKSAESIEDAASAMENLASSANAQQKESVQNSIEELHDLVSQVAVDKVDGIEELNYFFAKAGRAMTGLHMHITESYYFNLHGKEAGAELMEAVHQVERTVKYHGREFDDEEKTLIKEIKSCALRMKAGKNVSREELEGNLTKLENHLAKWQDEMSMKHSAIKNKREVIIHKQ